MIRLSKFLTFLLPLLTIFFLNQTNAQRPVTSSTISDVLTEIESDYAGLINIPTSQINTHLSTMLASSGSTMPPFPSLTDITGSDVKLSWAASLTFSEYRVGHLNLDTGADIIHYYSPSQIASYTIPNVPTGLNLFSVQAKNILTAQWEGVYIIILDKAVHKVILTDDIGCDCPGYLNETDLANYSGGPWPSVPIDKPFRLRIHNSSTGEDEGIIQGLREYWGGNSWYMKFNLECNQPEPSFFIEEEFYVLRFFKGNNHVGNFVFSPFFWQTPFGASQNYKIYYSECRPSRSFESSISNQFEEGTIPSNAVYPNPFSDELNINLPDIKSEINTVELYSSTGALVQRETYQNAGHKIVMNTSNIPSGAYFCVIKTATDIKRLQLVKP